MGSGLGHVMPCVEGAVENVPLFCTAWLTLNSEPEVRCPACRFTAGKGMGLNALAASGNAVAAGSEGCVYFWDTRSNEQLACFDDTHPEAVTQASSLS